MDSKAPSLLFIALLCFLSTTSTAFNITKILEQFDGFANFNILLTQSGLAKEINTRQTVTVLALDDGSIDGLSGRPVDIVKRILSAHVLLDYFDQLKISKLGQANTTVTTLYQASGIADDQQGFLRISRSTEGGIKFGSAQKGAPLVASLLKSVYTQPYNISVLQVSEPIVTPGIENMAPPPPPGTAAVPKKAPAPAAANKTAPAPTTAKTPAKSPAKSPSGAPPPSTEKPSTPTEAPAEGPASAGGAAGSPEADAPVADGPAAADAPAADAPAADAPVPNAPKKGASSRMQVGGAAMVVGLLACVMGF